MIEVNFFEKKEINILPYVLAGVFFVFAVILGTYFYFMHTYYVGLEQDHSQWIQNNAEDVTLSRQIERLDRSANQSARVQETLEESAYPMSYITEDLSAVFSSEGEQVTAFQIGDTSQAVFILENTTVTEASSIINDLETRSYVDRVQLLRLENQQTESDQFLFELTVDLNEDALLEESDLSDL